MIDENLTPGLVKFAASRGFLARHVNEAGLRTTSDKAVARYALDHDFIVVTNNMVHFRQHYRRRRMHPGLIFLACTIEEIFTRENQAALLNVALDYILENDILQEIVLVQLLGEDDAGEIEYELSPSEFPEH